MQHVKNQVALGQTSTPAMMMLIIIAEEENEEYLPDKNYSIGNENVKNGD